MFTSAIIVAAGKGKRMGTGICKQFLELNGVPIVVRTVLKFEKCDLINEIILVLPSGCEDWFKDEMIPKYGLKKVSSVVSGGPERGDSVFRGINNSDSKSDIILIHDGVRPFVESEEIGAAAAGAAEYGACVIGVRVKDTIKTSDSDGLVKNTLSREQLWSIQTPQAFKRDIIRQAYINARDKKIYATDDASIAEELGVPVKIIEGKYSNIKITNIEDLSFGEVLAKNEALAVNYEEG